MSITSRHPMGVALTVSMCQQASFSLRIDASAQLGMERIVQHPIARNTLKLTTIDDRCSGTAKKEIEDPEIRHNAHDSSQHAVTQSSSRSPTRS